MLDRLIELETAVSYRSDPPMGERPFIYQSGRLPILVSAPHATMHRRGQRHKREEGFTGGIARLLAETTGSHALFSRYRSPDDPNWDRHSPYKRRLQEVIQAFGIRFVLDLHGMSNRHNIGLALGTMNGRSCPKQESLILETVEYHRFRKTSQAGAKSFSTLNWEYFVLNHSRFTGGLANHTVTRFVSQALGVPALQIELCSSVRVVQRATFHGLPKGIGQTLALLQALVERLATAV